MNNLIVTLTSLYDKESIDYIMKSEVVSSVRYNSGVNDLLTPYEVVNTLKSISEMYKKIVWIDLKGRQLRIESWADPRYEAVELNHDIEIEYPAFIHFRGTHEFHEIAHTRKNKVVLTRPPRLSVGKGQSVNIRAKSLNIKGYLTDKDIELIRESRNAGLNHYMASFVEDISDLQSISCLNKDSIIISKIESLRGMEFIRNTNFRIPLMAARDDLFVENDNDYSTIELLKEILKNDENAICASRLFSSNERSIDISLQDYEDIDLMKMLGYKNFMLGDEIRGEKLKKILSIWKGL